MLGPKAVRYIMLAWAVGFLMGQRWTTQELSMALRDVATTLSEDVTSMWGTIDGDVTSDAKADVPQPTSTSVVPRPSPPKPEYEKPAST